MTTEQPGHRNQKEAKLKAEESSKRRRRIILDLLRDLGIEGLIPPLWNHITREKKTKGSIVLFVINEV